MEAQVMTMMVWATETTGAPETTREQLTDVWHLLVQRNGWNLIEDEPAFLDEAITELGELIHRASPAALHQMALYRVYSVRLYEGLWRREERAAQELWLVFMRLALQKGWQHAEAEDLAQEALVRVLEKLSTLRDPRSLLAWSFMICRTVYQASRADERRESASLATTDADQMEEIRDPGDPAQEIEQRVIAEEILNLLKAKLPNELERQTMMRIICFGEKPREIAGNLGLPLSRARLAKARALQRLRNDEDAVRMLTELVQRD